MIRVARLMVILHVALAFTTAVHIFFTTHTAIAWGRVVERTPVNDVAAAAEAVSNPFGAGGVLSGWQGPFSTISHVVDFVFGASTVDYGILDLMASDGGLVALFPLAVRTAAGFATLSLFIKALRFLFDSGLLSSTTGLLLVGGTTASGLIAKLLASL